MPYTINQRGIFDFAYATAWSDSFSGYLGEENEFNGLSGADTIVGLDKADMLAGGDGNDLIYGDQGKDRLYGDAGDDKIFSGQGKDKLWGGEGRDDFCYDRISECRDKIKDFVPGEDRIVLRFADFDQGRDGLSFDYETSRLNYTDDTGRVVLVAKLNTPISVEHDVILV